MLITEILHEGGFTDVATQDTELRPSTVKTVLGIVESFVNKLNPWLESQGYGAVRIGPPVGSSAYYDVDSEDTVYGDIDLQMIAPEIEGKTDMQVNAIYNRLVDAYISQTNPPEVYQTGKPANGHVIFQSGDDRIQVDLMWTTEPRADWAQHRSTPERGVKGAISGQIFSVLGELISVSIQSQGAQVKIRDGEPAPYARTRKYDELVTITTDIGRFGLDIAEWMAKQMGISDPEISSRLSKHPGLQRGNVRIEDLIRMVQGMAETFELNGMWGKYNLADYSNQQEFMTAFQERFAAKTDAAMNAKKYDKAETPAALAMVKRNRDKLQKGLDLVNSLLDS